MARFSRFVIGALAFQLIAAVPAAAQMWCEGRLVEVGASEQQVRDLCGSPDSTQVLDDGAPMAYAGTLYRQERSDEWTYNLGPGQFVRHLIFLGGILQQVRHGGYGTGP